jgi:hypothetical protein
MHMRPIQVLIIMTLVVPTFLSAQPGMGPEHRPFERIEQWKKVRLIEMLDLKEEQSVRFLARLNEHEGNRRDLMKEKGEALDRIERLVRNHADEKEFEKVFPEVAVVDDKIAEEGKRFFANLSDILSAEQRGKFMLFERHFERELREAMREVQRRRGHPEEP